jgi:hypothetical protein
VCVRGAGLLLVPGTLLDDKVCVSAFLCSALLHSPLSAQHLILSRPWVIYQIYLHPAAVWVEVIVATREEAEEGYRTVTVSTGS